MRVLFVVPNGSRAPGPRYRVLQFLPYYESSGVDCTVRSVQGERSTDRSLGSVALGRLGRILHLGSVWVALQLSFLAVVRGLRGFDLIYLYRVAVPVWAAFVLRRRGVPVVVDFDDAVDRGEEGWSWLHRHVLWAGVQRGIAISRGVIVSNSRNAEIVRLLRRPVSVVPTCVELGRYPYRSRRTPVHGCPIVGWIGTPSTAEYLTSIEGVLGRLLGVYEFRVRLVGSGRNPFRTIPAEVVPWSLDAEVEAVTSFDLGLMPTPNDVWASGKAALKGLQYGASGAPTVATFSETNAEILGLREGALLCSDEEEWLEGIGSLLADAGRREEIGRAGRRRVERFFSVESNAPRLLDLMDRAKRGSAWEGV